MDYSTRQIWDGKFYKIQDGEFKMSDSKWTRWTIQDGRLKMKDSRWRIQDSRFKMADPDGTLKMADPRWQTHGDGFKMVDLG